MITRIAGLIFVCFMLTMITSVTEVAADKEANKALVNRIFEEILNQGNLELVDEFYAADYVFHLTGNPDIHGPEGLKQYFRQTLAIFPDLQYTVHEIIARDDMVVDRWTAKGTHQGEIAEMGIPPTGKQVTLTGITMHRVADGKIVEDWGVYDALGILQQVGAVTPGRPGYGWGTPSDITGTPGDPEANETMVLDFIEELWNKQNLGVLDGTHHPDIAAHTPVELNNPLVGLEVNKHTVKLYLTAFPDMHVINEDVFAEGDKVVARWTTTATHGGELMGMPPTGARVQFSGVIIYRLADGKAVENWWAWDALGLMQQLTAPSEQD